MQAYSSIFASGLLATPRPSRHGRNDSIDMDTTPTSSKAFATSFTNPFPPHIEDVDMSGTDADFFGERSRTSSTTSGDQESATHAPRLRRRRSSLSVNPAANPLASVRSPLRNAGAALQRTLAGARSRSGSVAASAADDVLCADTTAAAPASAKGRLRSGSLGTALRSTRRVMRKPSTAPPAIPLPALPPMPAGDHEMPPMPTRRPLLHRAHNSDHAALSFGQSASFLGTGKYGRVSPMDSMLPSPVDPIVPFVASMKEN